MLTFTADGVLLDEMLVEWGLLRQHGLSEQDVVYYYSKIPSAAEDAVWDVFRSSIVGER